VALVAFVKIDHGFYQDTSETHYYRA